MRSYGKAARALLSALLIWACALGAVAGQVNLSSGTGASNASAAGNFGTQGVENVYTEYDGPIDRLAGEGLMPWRVYLLSGDTIEVTASTVQPADFISANTGYFSNYMGGRSTPLVTGNDPVLNTMMGGKTEVYQDESYSGATAYYLNKQVDRTYFILDIRDAQSKERQRVSGHLKVVIHSRYSSAEHKQSYENDMGKAKAANEWTGRKLDNPSAYAY
jgi:hypothetical protein